MPENEGAEQEKAPAQEKAAGGFLVGSRGWIIIVAVVVLEALFFIVWNAMNDRQPPDKADEGKAARTIDDYRLITYEIKDVNTTIPTATSLEKTLSASFTIVIERSDKEIRSEIEITPDDVKKIEDALKKMEPEIRDHLMTYLTSKSHSHLASMRGKEILKNDIKSFVNKKLSEIDLQLSKPEIDTENRVKQVDINSFIMQ